MTQHRLISDAELTAYLDGEAEPELLREIETQLATDSEMQTRLSALEIPMEALRVGFDRQVQTAPAMPPLPTADRRRFGVVPFASGLAAGLAIAMIAGWFLRPAPWEGWARFAAAYQTLYVTETLASVEASPDDIAKQLSELGQSFGLDLTPVTAVDGMEFKRGQTLGFNGKPLAQLAFLTPDGVPVAFCIIRSNGAETTAMRSGAIQGLAAAQWSRDGYGFLLVGGQDQALIDRAAQDLSQQI
ncbi:MAG: hypothetical protein GJ676_10240 [Rhodobacteraceae bacterium]|nr:hypothetical protein [Paracoccaceae bacterium]